MSLINANQLLTSIRNLTSFIQKSSYSSRSRNILRNRYNYRNKDGTFKEYNESIQVLPKEFEEQDEYKAEKKITKMYEDRYKQHMKYKEKLYSVKLPNEKLEQAMNTCEHSGSSQLAESSSFDDSNDMPVKLKQDPYTKKMHQCVFCKYNIPLDYKNTQLLSQFVSQFTGLVYSQEVTGLCLYKYKELEETIFKARRLGLMPFFYKETLFLNDPELFDPSKNNLREAPDNFDKRKLVADDVNTQPKN